MADKVDIEVRIRRNVRSNQIKKGPQKKRRPLSAGLCPAATGLSSDETEHRRQDRATTTERRHGGDDRHGKLAIDDSRDPPKKAMGPKTAAKHEPDAIRALVIWSMDLRVASLGGQPFQS